MNLWTKVSSRLRTLFRRSAVEAEMSAEMAAHLEMQAERYRATGMSPEEASFAARRNFGGVDQIKEIARDQRGWVWLEQWGRDFRFSFRSLRRAPGFSMAVIVTLTLCIGANTTILSVLYGLILKPMPFRDAGQLVEVYTSFPKNNQPKRRTSVAQYLDYKANADLFAVVALWQFWTFNIGEESDPDRGIGARVTADYFTMLGVQPLLGRFYTMDECVPGNDAVLVLTQTYWEKKYRADPSVVGRVIRIDGRQFTIIGVAPRSLEALNADTTLLKPFEWAPQLAMPLARTASSAMMYARLKSGVAPLAALTQLTALEKRFQTQVAPPALREYLDRGGFKMELSRVRTEQTKSIRTSLLLLQGGACLVLLLGCVNVANLMLARANARQSELAIRQALGAGRGALASQMIVEGLLLAGCGAAIGLALTWTSLRVINSYTTAIIREVQPIALDGTVLGATLLVTLIVAGAIALLPIARTWRTNLLAAMQGGTKGASAGGGMRAISGLLVTAQVALALMLLVGAGLLIHSFAKVMAVDPGFDAKHVVQGRVAFYNSIHDLAGAQSMRDLIIARMKEIPGVEKVGITSNFPLNANFAVQNFPIRGSTQGPEDTYPSATMIGASPGYLEAMGIRLLEGRAFNAADLLPQARPVFIVDENFAKKYFPGRSAVGETFDFKTPNLRPDRWPMIVGVVKAAKLSGTDNVSGIPFVFRPLPTGGAFSLVLWTDRPAEVIVPLMREKLRSVDPTVPLYIAGSLQDTVDELLANRRGVLWLLGAFAGIALLLSAVGIYGMLAYDVSQRTKEIGIRGAIGASRGQIVALILRQGLWKTGVGLIIGLGGAFFLSRFMRSLLFEVPPTDPLSFIGVSLLLLLVALLASWLPARRAARIDPLVSLRAE
jgi:predicted permease